MYVLKEYWSQSIYFISGTKIIENMWKYFGENNVWVKNISERMKCFFICFEGWFCLHRSMLNQWMTPSYYHYVTQYSSYQTTNYQRDNAILNSEPRSFENEASAKTGAPI